MLVETEPFSSTFRKCSVWVSTTTSLRTESSALSLIAVSQRCSSLSLFQLGYFVHDILPCPARPGGVACLPIDAGQVQAERPGHLRFRSGRRRCERLRPC